MSLTEHDPVIAHTAAVEAPRRQRADAERNRRALILAAVDVFGELGLDATVSEIAHRAGVGQGTAFRHFPTKEHLIAAIVVDLLDRITTTAVALLDEPDSLKALRELMHVGASLMVNNHGFKDAAVNHAVIEDSGVQAGQDRLNAVVSELIGRAQEDGHIRADLIAEDIPLLLCAISATDVPRVDDQPALWERYFEIIFAGMCAPASGHLESPAPTQDELRAHKAATHAPRG